VQCQRLFRPARHTLSLTVYNFSIFLNKYLDHCMRNGLLQPPGNPLPPPPPFAPDAVPMNRFTRSVRGVIIGSRNNICIPSEETNACPLHLRVDYSICSGWFLQVCHVTPSHFIVHDLILRISSRDWNWCTADRKINVHVGHDSRMRS
jgi:hypothetical protein